MGVVFLRGIDTQINVGVIWTNFKPFFSKYKFFEVATFFLISRPTYWDKPTFFSSSSNLQRSCYWWTIFSSLAIVTMKIRKVYFSYFLVKYWSKFLQHNYAPCQAKLCLEKQNETNTSSSIKIVPMMHLLPFCKGPRPWGKNVTKFSFTFASIYHIPKWIWFAELA